MIDLIPGRAVGDGRYRLKRRLGAGGMASVWLAVDERLHREVAVKLLADTLAGDERYLARFAREARAAASVSGPLVVPVYDYGIEGQRPYLVMEHVAGGNLASRLVSPQTPPDASRLARELLGALMHIHDAGLVHRDVKPANILLDDRDHARVTDFGIAQAEDATSLTQTGMVIGTLRYIAPEVAAGEVATPAADLFAAGVVLGEVVRRSASGGLDALIEALTAPSPTDRPSSAAAALDLLDRGQATRGDPSRPHPGAVRRPTASTAGARASTRIMAARRARATGASRSRGAPRLSRETRWALVAMSAVAAILVAFAIASGGQATPTAHPAAPRAPLGQQLRALSDMVTRASRP